MKGSGERADDPDQRPAIITRGIATDVLCHRMTVEALVRSSSSVDLGLVVRAEHADEQRVVRPDAVDRVVDALRDERRARSAQGEECILVVP